MAMGIQVANSVKQSFVLESTVLKNNGSHSPFSKMKVGDIFSIEIPLTSTGRSSRGSYAVQFTIHFEEREYQVYGSGIDALLRSGRIKIKPLN